MDDCGIEGVAIRAGIEDTVSGIGEAVVEGVGICIRLSSSFIILFLVKDKICPMIYLND